MSKNIGQTIELIDGTASKKSYIVVQEKKAATLAIKPEMHNTGSNMVVLLRIRAIADRGSVHGVNDHVAYLKQVYKDLPFSKLDEVRGSYYLIAEMQISSLAGFFDAENGEYLLRRLIYKVVLALVSEVQVKSGYTFFDIYSAVNFLTDKMMDDVSMFGNFDSETKHQLPVNDDVTELFQLPDLSGE